MLTLNPKYTSYISGLTDVTESIGKTLILVKLTKVAVLNKNDHLIDWQRNTPVIPQINRRNTT